MKLEELESLIGGTCIEGGDNVAIVIASYFDLLPKPEGDEMDEERGWSKWVISETNTVLKDIATNIMYELKREGYGID